MVKGNLALPGVKVTKQLVHQKQFTRGTVRLEVALGGPIPGRPPERPGWGCGRGCEEEAALIWLELAVAVLGWIDYVYFTGHDRLLESLQAEPVAFPRLMAGRTKGLAAAGRVTQTDSLK
jgi:hypothetical protein